MSFRFRLQNTLEAGTDSAGKFEAEATFEIGLVVKTEGWVAGRVAIDGQN